MMNRSPLRSNFDTLIPTDHSVTCFFGTCVLDSISPVLGLTRAPLGPYSLLIAAVTLAFNCAGDWFQSWISG